MKKYYSLVLAGMMPVLMFAQSEPVQCKDEAPSFTKIKRSNDLYDHKSSGTAFWSEDFSNGWPAGWTTQNPGGLCPWKWSLNGSHGFWNGNNGATYGDSIASTTAGDGFLIADNDSANHFNFGQPSGTTYEYLETYFTTSAIDLSAHPAVKLEFEQNYRYNNDVPMEVMVSNDSVNWTTWYVDGDIANNTESDNPELVGINISSVAGSEATVYIKIGWSARVYFWMIDDMRIVEAPEYDLRLDNVYYNEWFFDQAPDFSALEFSIFPTSQIRPQLLKSNFTNNGTALQEGVTMEVNVFDDSNTNVLNATESMVTPLAPGDNDSLSIATNVLTSLGRYTIEYEIYGDSTDFNPIDNTAEKWFEISDYIFARDTGALDGNIDNQDEAYELGNWFNMANDGMLYGIDVAIDDASAVGTTIYGIIYDANRDPLEETEEYEITAADLNAAGDAIFVTLPFSTPVDLFAGEDYLVMGGHFGGPDNVVFGTSGISPAQTSLIWDVPVATWFYVTSTPMVRMNFDPSVGIEDVAFDNGMKLGQNVPNPFGDMSQITFEVDQAMDVTFEVRDLTGKLVQYNDLGKIVPGIHTIDVSASELGDGVYFYSLTTNTHSLTKRMVILDSAN